MGRCLWRKGLSSGSVSVEFSTQNDMDDIEKIAQAITRDHIGEVKEILDKIDEKERKATLSKQRDHGTLLHLAVNLERPKIVEYLIDMGSELEARNELDDDSDDTPLHLACKKNKSTEILRFLIGKGCDITALNLREKTPLEFAMESNREDFVKVLIDINVRDQSGMTSLHRAVYKNRPDMVNTLIEKGADIFSVKEYLQKIDKKENVKTKEETTEETNEERNPIDVEFHKKHFTPLYSAMLCEDQQCMNNLLEHMKNLNTDADKKKIKNWINLSNGDQTVLQLAVKRSKLDTIKTFVALGSDVNQLNDRGESVLHTAAAKGDKPMIDFLLEINGDLIKSVCHKKKTPLHLAAQHGRDEVVLDLIKRGIKVDALDDDKNTPLFLAASETSNRKTFQLLLENKANISMVNKYGFTVLHRAVDQNNEAAVDVLLKSTTCTKDIIDVKTKEEPPAVHLACHKGYEKIALMLLNKDADVNIPDDKYWRQTLLHIATYRGQEKVTERILNKNAICINDVDQDGDTPLHNAVYDGHQKVISLLLKFGASIHAKNYEADTPILMASAFGHVEVVKELIKQGASLEDKNPASGYGCLHYSCENGHRELTAYLLSECNEQDIGFGQTKGWNEGCNALDLAIQNSHDDIAKLIIDHNKWKKFLRNKSDGMTPVRRMIQHMPDVAHNTFSRCISGQKNNEENKESCMVKFNYEFIDMVEDDEKKTDEKGTQDIHPLRDMIKFKRNELLIHPLVIACIEKKWRHVAFIYYLKLFLYTLFLFFLTGFVLVNSPVCYNSTNSTNTRNFGSIQLSKPIVKSIFVDFGKYMVLLLALMHLIFEIIQIICRRKDYFSWVNLLEWIIFVLAIVNVLADFISSPLFESITKCGIYRNSTGAVCIFFGWLNFILFLRNIGVFGIYVVMLIHVSKTFFKFFTVFVFLIAAFGFSFCVLLQNQSGLPGFHNPLSAFVRTIVMMTGELGFDEIFYQDPHQKDVVLWIIFVIFVLIMNIVLMNLLVGLAVDDIISVQKEAEMAKAVMKINLCLEFDKLIPKQFKKQQKRKRKQQEQEQGQEQEQEQKQEQGHTEVIDLETTESVMSLSKETIETIKDIVRRQKKEETTGKSEKVVKQEAKNPNEKLLQEIEERLEIVRVGMENRLDVVKVGMEKILDEITKSKTQ